MKNRNDIHAFILCGGKSSRMGKDKSFILYQGIPFIEWSLNAITPITQNISLVTDNSLYAKYSHPIVTDIFKQKGPVAAIHAALNSSSLSYNLILSCDLPLINSKVLSLLVNNCSPNIDVLFLRKHQKDYPLIGIYQKRALKVFEQELRNNNLKLMNIIQKLTYRAIDIPPEYFENVQNINTPEELEIIKNLSK